MSRFTLRLLFSWYGWFLISNFQRGCLFLFSFFFHLGVMDVEGNPQSHTRTWHAHQRHYKKTRTLHATSVHNTSGTKKLRNERIIRSNWRNDTWWNTSNRGRRKKTKIFSHYLVSVKNRNSPVTFTLHFLIIYMYVHGFILIICHCLLCLYQQFTKERKLQSNAYTLLERCA